MEKSCVQIYSAKFKEVKYEDCYLERKPEDWEHSRYG